MLGICTLSSISAGCLGYKSCLARLAGLMYVQGFRFGVIFCMLSDLLAKWVLCVPDCGLQDLGLSLGPILVACRWECLGNWLSCVPDWLALQVCPGPVVSEQQV